MTAFGNDTKGIETIWRCTVLNPDTQEIVKRIGPDPGGIRETDPSNDDFFCFFGDTEWQNLAKPTVWSYTI